MIKDKTKGNEPVNNSPNRITDSNTIKKHHKKHIKHHKKHKKHDKKHKKHHIKHKKHKKRHKKHLEKINNPVIVEQSNSITKADNLKKLK